MTTIQELDVVVVGAGFGGIFMTHKCKEAGWTVACLEKAPKPAGVWYWNCYPGARVDSRFPVYQYTDPKVANSFTWDEAFPDYKEIRRYLEHAVETWGIGDDIHCGAEVTDAKFDDETHKWTITCADGRRFRSQWFINALGFATKPYIPAIPGLESFKGPSFHTARWPQEGIDVKGKKVAVIGTGASAVQVIQTIAPEVGEMVVYQRTPSVALPLRNHKLSKDIQDFFKSSGKMAALQKTCKYEKFGGQDTAFVPSRWADDTPEQRREVFQAAWAKGGFHPLLSTYFDLFINREVNKEAWRFWAEKCRARIEKPEMRDILAPLEPAYIFGGKQTPMEIDYFEAFNRPNVSLVDVKSNPIAKITPAGIECENGDSRAFDIIVLATGFDANTGALSAVNILDTSGTSLKQRWEDGVHTQFGLSTSGSPNMFFSYGPQAPTAFSNGPSCIELQLEYVCDFIRDMKAAGVTRVENTVTAEQAWRQSTFDLWNKFVFSETKGYYCGANIPGKKEEPLNWFGGLATYHKILTKSREEGYGEYAKTALREDEPELVKKFSRVAVHAVPVNV